MTKSSSTSQWSECPKQGLQHIAGNLPHIAPTEPVRELCSSDFGGHNRVAWGARSMLKVRPQQPPKTINDLRSTLHLHRSPRGQIQGVDLGVVWLSSGFLNWGLANAVFRGLNLTKHCNAQKIPKNLIPNLTKPCNAQKIPKIPTFWHLCPGQDHIPENFGIF